MNETPGIHQAPHELPVKLLPQYEADEDPLTAAQLHQIKKAVLQNCKRSVQASLVVAKAA